jgi:uncharacterized repeat protein (TIGR01451 family)
VRHRRLTGAVLLGACLLLGAARIYGQRQVIATSVTVTNDTPPAPPGPAAAAAAPVAPPGAIQQVSYVPDPPKTGPAVQQPPPAPTLPPTALQGMMNNAGAVNPRNLAETMTATLSVEVVGPDRIVLGKPMVHEIVVRNTGTRRAAEVRVEEPVPADVRVGKTDPPALEHNNRLIWDLHNLEAGGERRLKIELNPSRPGELDLRPYLTFQSGSGLLAQVIRPPFSIEIHADRTKVTRGERISFKIELANHGDAPIRNIKIYDTLPAGLHHPKGPIMAVERFGDLMPNETKSIPLETTAVASGPFHNEVIAQADRGVEASASLDGVISEPSLSLHVDGPAKTMTGHDVDFSLEVVNPSALTAKQVRLVQALPPTFEVVASTGASLDSNLHTLVWSLSDLGAGQRQRVMFRIKANTAGDWPMCTAVMSQNLPEARVNCTLHAESAAALSLDVRAGEDHLSVGAETVLRMHLFNRGDAPCTGVQLTAVLPEAAIPFKAEGPSNGQIAQQQVRFAPLAQLDAHGDVFYRIHVRGRQAGKGTVRVQLTAEKQTPADREISIQVNAAEQKASADAAAENVKPASAETLR